ncbi:methylated-DNA--[protein]-cysteine S-methyltransferase [Novispirillum itersonii]|uniref:methylated-DNA--[protein]-cysteine S-methyltransferase n=1 Tax=Novispirillum itersonii TaxID=189 RepID=UPI0006867B04|nr:methylated-DNA--[protein]-cysteine S-methyltransferase [Novispirillum itersonii]
MTAAVPLSASGADLWQDCRDYQRIAEAIRWLEDRRFDQPSLEEAAAAIGLSPFHFQRLFTRWAGVSPKRFVSWLTLDHARQLLQQDMPVLETALEVGLSGPGRLHDLCVTLTAATPGDLASGGAGMTIRAAEIPTPFGPALAAVTERGLCALEFLAEEGAAGQIWQQLRQDWPAAEILRDEAAVRDLPQRLFPRSGDQPPSGPLAVFVKGSPFQVAVWAALLRIPPGARASYGAVAAAVGHPGAARAVGTALASNRIGYVIPCHRVLQSSGAFRSYRWGRERRHAILGWETARLSV